MSDELVRRVEALEERLNKHHGPTILEHGDRLDRYERQLAELRTAHVETRNELRTLSTQVGRLSDIATTQGLSLERIARNVDRLLEILEPRKVVVDADS